MAALGMQLIGFSSSLYGKLDGKLLDLAISKLGKELSMHLKREVPEEKYSTPSEWVQAIKREVDEVLLLAVCHCKICVS